jgi:hypothetical protein
VTEAEPARRACIRRRWQRPLGVAAAAGLLLLSGACGDDGAEPAASPVSTPVVTASTTTTGGATPSSTSLVDGAGRSFSAGDDGVTIGLTVGAASELLLSADGPEPILRGDAVELIPIASFTDAGGRQYEIRGRTPGVATVTGQAPAFVLTFVVK